MEPKDPIKAMKAFFTDRLGIEMKENPIHIGTEDGIVLVEGTVEKISQKKRAILHAMMLDSVSGVVDRLKVAPANHMGDDEIRDHMYDALTEEPTLNASEIKIEVNSGVMDIEGTVGSLSHKRLAGVLAWWIPGTVDVINSLEIVPPEEDSDDEVTDALRIIMEKDRLVDAGALTISCKDWVVTLDGVLGSDAEKEAAEDDAWFTWGVNEVVNLIRVEETSIHEVP